MSILKTTAMACAVAAAATSFSGAAFAQGRDRDNERAERRDDRREHRREAREERRDRHADTRWDRGSAVVRAQPLAPAPAPHVRQRSWNPYTPQYSYSAPRYYPSYNNYPRYVSNYSYAQPRARYYVGGYVPVSYRQPYYYVNDWHAYNLYAPPYGHQWVRTDTGDYLLMALATGLIANLIFNHR